jgi:hypothetical protein
LSPIEAGGRDWNPLVHILVGFMKLLDHPTLTWNFKAEGDPGTAGTCEGPGVCRPPAGGRRIRTVRPAYVLRETGTVLDRDRRLPMEPETPGDSNRSRRHLRCCVAACKLSHRQDVAPRFPVQQRRYLGIDYGLKRFEGDLDPIAHVLSEVSPAPARPDHPVLAQCRWRRRPASRQPPRC